MISWISVFAVIFEIVIGILFLLLSNQNNFITWSNRILNDEKKAKTLFRNIGIVSLTLALLNLLWIIIKILGAN